MSQWSSFRTLHTPEVVALYEHVFGARARAAFERRWRWSQEANLAPADTPKWVLLAQGRVVGFLATMPLPYRVGGAQLIAHTPCDYMVHERYRFGGLTLMRELFRACQNVVACDDVPATIRVTCWLGAQRIASMQRYIKLLDARALGRHGSVRLPKPLWQAGNIALRGLDAPLGSLAPRYARDVELCCDFDARFDRFFEEARACAPASIVKDRRFLSWRYGPGSPHAHREVGICVDTRRRIVGYVIYCKLLPPSRAGLILDVQVLPAAGYAVAAALLGFAAQRLRRQGAWTAYLHRLTSPSSLPRAVLALCGFHKAQGGHELLVSFASQRARSVASQASAWWLGFGDTEASHGIV